MTALVWTSDPPKVRGLYWCRGRFCEPEVVNVYCYRGEWSVEFTGDARRRPIGTIDIELAEWAGPISPPVDPAP